MATVPNKPGADVDRRMVANVVSEAKSRAARKAPKRGKPVAPKKPAAPKKAKTVTVPVLPTRPRPTVAQAPKATIKALGRNFLRLSPAAQQALKRAHKVSQTALPTVAGKPAPKTRRTVTRPSMGYRAGTVLSYGDVRLEPVVSSNVAAVGYGEEDAVLYVSFLNGSLYGYYGVGEDVYRSMLAASSKGKFVWEHLRGAYEYRRLQ